MIMKWRHTSGFSVDNSVRIARDNESGTTALAQYIIRSPFSEAKLSYNNTGTVVYRSKMTHGKNKQNFSISTAEEFIATITQHIPENSFQLVKYRAWYSNRMRGDWRKQKSLRKETERQTSNEIEKSSMSRITNHAESRRRYGGRASKKCGKLILWSVRTVRRR